MNPLTPSYKMKDINGAMSEYGHIADSTPRTQYYRKNEKDILVNSVKGIALCGTDTTKKLGAFKTKERTDFRKINDVSGIDGAKFMKKNPIKSYRINLKPNNIITHDSVGSSNSAAVCLNRTMTNNEKLAVKKPLLTE